MRGEETLWCAVPLRLASDRCDWVSHTLCASSLHLPSLASPLKNAPCELYHHMGAGEGQENAHCKSEITPSRSSACSASVFLSFFFFLVIAFVFVVFSTPGPFQKDSSTPCCSVGFYLPLLDTCSCPAAFAVTEEVAARLPPFCPWQVTQPAAQTLSEF